MESARQQDGRHRILAITGTRAEYGLLYPVLVRLRNHPRFDLRLLATCMHLEDRFGRTVDEIRADGFSVDAEVPLAIAGDADLDIARAMSRALAGIADVLQRLQPDAVLLLGDRFEIMAAAAAAAAMRTPVIHLEGGHVTYGAVDDAFRHAITKLSHLHFTSCEEYRRRIIQMGEEPERVHAVGATGLDNILGTPRLSRQELAESIGMSLAGPFFLITFHPATLDRQMDDAAQVEELLAALRQFPEHGMLITGANADAGNRAIFERLHAFVQEDPQRRCLVTSLGRRRYISALAECDCVIGNSSSGIIEAPSFGVGTVNIGRRQEGRLRAESVLDVPVQREAIANAIRRAISPAFRERVRKVRNPYGDGHAAERIMKVLERTDFSALLHKRFLDLDCALPATHERVS